MRGIRAGTVLLRLTFGQLDSLPLGFNQLELPLTRLGGWSYGTSPVGAIYAAHRADRMIAT